MICVSTFRLRDGMHILQFALKRLVQNQSHSFSKDKAWQEAVIKVLGDDALDLDRLAQQRQRMLGSQALPTGLGDFFFDSNDPLHPDREDDEESEE